MPAAIRMWSPKGSPRSKSRTGGRKSARCCCIESPKDQRSSSTSKLVTSATNNSRSFQRPPKPSRSHSESQLSKKTPVVTHCPLTPPLLYGLDQSLVETHSLEPHKVFSTPACTIADKSPEVESTHTSLAVAQFKYEEEDLLKLEQCATCKQSWRAAFDAHREQAVCMDQAVEKEKLKSTKAKKAVCRERAKLAEMEAEHAENMEILRIALRQEQAFRREAECNLDSERSRCAEARKAFESVKLQFEMMQGVFEELQPLLRNLAIGFVMESHAVQEHIEDLTKTAVERLMSFSDLAEKTQQLFSSSGEDYQFCSSATALPSISSPLLGSTSATSTRACSSNSSGDEEFDISNDSFGNPHLNAETFHAEALSMVAPTSTASSTTSLSVHRKCLDCDIDESSDDQAIFVHPRVGTSKKVLRPTVPAPRQPRPLPPRKSSVA